MEQRSRHAILASMTFGIAAVSIVLISVIHHPQAQLRPIPASNVVMVSTVTVTRTSVSFYRWAPQTCWADDTVPSTEHHRLQSLCASR